MISHNMSRIARARRRVAIVVGVGVLAAASGAGSAMATAPPDDSTAESAQEGTAAPAEAALIAVTLTETSIDGLPTDLVAGVVDVTVTDETEGAGGELNFTRVEPGTDVATFVEGLATLFEGGPFPDYVLNNSGAAAHTITTLDAGEYMAWIDLAANLDRPSTVDDIIAVPMTVGAGDDTAVIPPTDGGSIRAGDYLFDADVSAGGTTVTFTNSSDNQFHHVIIMDFGTNDPAVVEAIMPEFLASEEDAPPPEGIDMEQVNFEFASSPVFGPGSSGTFEAPFEAGHTYAAMCFIQDRDGGAPHAIAHQMFDVFQVG
jgi:hypothetical protein